ncbi:MAG: TIM44-like domain-containing protein [Betaproteobacteria bacterium]|jgi:predicted lipid-binding transport protein (Tim44 family)
MSTSHRVRPAAFTLAGILAATVIALSLVSTDADARRLGGGKSFGKQSATVTRQQSAAPPSQQTAPPAQAPAGAPVPQPTGNRWLGPLAGIGVGLGIGALLSHFGLGGAFADGLGGMLVIGLLLVAGVFLWRMLQRSVASPAPVQAMNPIYAAQLPQDENSRAGVSVLGTPLPSLTPEKIAADQPWGVPSEFDAAGFLRNAKLYFIRLQAAWDEKNLADIREFTTPEVFAEIRLQIDEEKGAVNKTQVDNLDAVLLGIETGPVDYLASVRFSGSSRENGQADAAPFQEVWNLSKPVDGRGGWLLAGIQQLQ